VALDRSVARSRERSAAERFRSASRREALLRLRRWIGTLGCCDGRDEVAEWLRLSGGVAWGKASVAEIVGRRLVEHEVRYGFGLGGIEGRSLVEEKVPLGRTTSG
jgi:hypothetical protein